MLHIYHYGEIHARGIANDYNVAVSPIQLQLDKFENGGLLVSKEIGRSRLYSINPKSPFSKPVIELLKIEYETISIEERQEIFGARRRPRTKGKKVIK